LQGRRGGGIMATMTNAPASPMYASRFLLAMLVTMMPVAGSLIGDNYHAFLVTFVVIPVLDWLAGHDASNLTPASA
jgi:hypothetical protein